MHEDKKRSFISFTVKHWYKLDTHLALADAAMSCATAVLMPIALIGKAAKKDCNERS
jgi:hypothetical protein